MLGGKIVALGLAFSMHSNVRKPEPLVRVRLKASAQSVELSGLDMQVGGARLYGLSRARIRYLGSNLWGIHDPTGRRIEIRAPRLIVRGALVRLGLTPVPNNLVFIPQHHRFTVIAPLKLNSYLAGVLPAEMPSSWPLEALKAQAIASRSFVLDLMSERRSEAYDVDSSVLDQVYRYQVATAKVRRAIHETDGQVLFDPHGHVLKAFFSADCGCQSEDPRYVWGKIDGFVSVKDPACQFERPVRWDAAFPRRDVHVKLAQAWSLPHAVQIENVSVATRTPSGRVAELVAWIRTKSGARRYTMGAQEFRRLFGFQTVRSANFQVQMANGRLQIEGQGLGHGVGLCQRGARVMAEHGFNYLQILNRYYPMAHLNRSGNQRVASSWNLQ